MSDAQALSILFKSPVSQDMIHHLVVATLQVLPCAHDKYPSPPSSPSKDGRQLPSLMTFISKLVRYTNVYTGTLMSTLVYLNRLRSKLPKDAQGMPCTRHRIFLACLILSSKYHNDSSPKNKHWAKYTDSLFDKADVNLMERQLLYLLNWDLRITEEDLASSLKRFVDPIKMDLRKAIKVRRSLQKHQKQQQQQQQQQQQHLHLQVPQHVQQQRYPLSPLPSPTDSPIRPSISSDSLHSRASSTCSVRTLGSDNEDIMLQRMTAYHGQQQQQQLHPTVPAPYPVDMQYDLGNIKHATLNEERELGEMLRQYELRY